MYTNKELKKLFKDTFDKSAGNKNKRVLETELYEAGVLSFDELSDNTKTSLQPVIEPVDLTEEAIIIEVETDKEGIEEELKVVEEPTTTPTSVKTYKGQVMVPCRIICPKINKYIGGFVYSGRKNELIDVAECHLPLLIKWKNVEKV